MKIQKRPFYDFKMKFMMYLDYSIWKFPIPRLREGGKQGGKLSHWLYKPKFLPFIHSRLRGRGGRASDFQSIGRRFDPWWRANFFSLFLFDTDLFGAVNQLGIEYDKSLHIDHLSMAKLLTEYSQKKKYPPDRDFLMQNSTDFGHFLKKYSKLRNFIYLIWKP